ncbi:MAG: 3'-5' exonuclease [Planctomycetaceae bacterium]|tara:strand:- start:3754 stop:4584 length:831 start_codon:yes stop_codon:yes gene_type:complete
MSDIRYLVFDIETVPDGELISRVRYPGQTLDPKQAIEKYQQELLEKNGSDFIPYTYHLPVSVVIGKINNNYELEDLVALDEQEGRPHLITRHFWKGWEKYEATLVTFNGRGFDIPVMELGAFRYGISLKKWFQLNARSFEQPRNRFNLRSHFDLQEVLTNHGASRMYGGLNLIANLIGKPGKMDVAGDMVLQLYHEGNLQRINDYCRCDVLDTYFVFLRTSVMTGALTLEREQQIVRNTRQWLEDKSEALPIYKQYLEHWGDWENPWSEQIDIQND